MSDREKIDFESFSGYYREADPEKRAKGYYWHTAIGLQDVDGLKPSAYLLDVAKKNIEGELSLSEAQSLIEARYREEKSESIATTKEADVVSSRISVILAEKGFTFSAEEFVSIHRRLFEGIFPFAGKLREYNITKEEWVLDGDTVTYGTHSQLAATLGYDISEERAFDYTGLSTDAVIKHMATFLSRLWQIHPFAEGNTRTTAVFFIKYLQSRGFDVTNDIFAENAWYFRNALVRANYTNLRLGVYETTQYLESFLRNVMCGETNPLKNRLLRIKAPEKQDIGAKKQDIGVKKQDIESRLCGIKGLSEKSIIHMRRLYSAFCNDIFGRTEVVKELDLSPAAASAILKKMLSFGIITSVKGKGKGKYTFS